MPSRERLPPLAAGAMTAEQKKASDEFEATRGYPLLGPFSVMLRSPEVMLRAKALGDYLRFRNVLPGHVRELVTLVTARQWTQQFEWSHHYEHALKAGLSRAASMASRCRVLFMVVFRNGRRSCSPLIETVWATRSRTAAGSGLSAQQRRETR